ncbi:hypothetical protein B296_00057093 [Ensete ventricosum]|uniref:Uncharacterized protein n=1 Tax=Ensete ventricosum TaxID=4639 RepID=A0A426WXK1_ENSVE|nr:hypothetical protein B296_00057093 [Ensete ventricosum]
MQLGTRLEYVGSLPGWRKGVRRKKIETHWKIIKGSRKACQELGRKSIFVLIFAAHVMHPLRFPNSGNRAMIFVRKIGFKLRVMRLYRIELFYVFLLHFRSKGSKEEGWPAMASPHAGSATDGQAVAKAPCMVAASCDQGQPERGGSRP